MIHTLIKRAREEEGLTQAMLAVLAGVPRSQLQILEKGGNVTRETLDKVMTKLGLVLAVLTPLDITRMRKALGELDAVLGTLEEQVAEAQDSREMAITGRHYFDENPDLIARIRFNEGEEAAEAFVNFFKEKTARELKEAEEFELKWEEKEAKRTARAAQKAEAAARRAEAAARKAEAGGRGKKGQGKPEGPA